MDVSAALRELDAADRLVADAYGKFRQALRNRRSWLQLLLVNQLLIDKASSDLNRAGGARLCEAVARIRYWQLPVGSPVLEVANPVETWTVEPRLWDGGPQAALRRNMAAALELRRAIHRCFDQLAANAPPDHVPSLLPLTE